MKNRPCFLSTDWKPISPTPGVAILSLSGSVASIMTSTSGWASLSSTAPVWTRGGETDGKMVPVTELNQNVLWVETPKDGDHTTSLFQRNFVPREMLHISNSFSCFVLNEQNWSGNKIHKADPTVFLSMSQITTETQRTTKQSFSEPLFNSAV